MTTRKRADPAPVTGTHTAPPAASSAEDPARKLVSPMPGDGEEALDGLLPLGISPLTPRGVGRPLNSPNKRTETVADYIVLRFGDPMTATASIAGRPLKELVTELRTIASDVGLRLGATVMEIARFQQECRRDVLPYVHAKRAPVDDKGKAVRPAVIAFGKFEEHHHHEGGRSIEDEPAKVIEGKVDQGVARVEGEASDGAASDDGTKR